MAINQAVSAQFDLEAIPLTVPGASRMGDEPPRRMQRALVYDDVGPGRPYWKIPD